MSIVYDIWNSYDPSDLDLPEVRAYLRERLERDRQIVRQMLPRLEQEIENPG